MDEPGAEITRRRESYLLLAAAVVLAALLQLVVFEQYTPERLITLVLILAGFGFMSWAYAGGYAHWVQRAEERRVRRHIRNHPELVTELKSLVTQVDEVLGPRTGQFPYVSQSLINDWYTKQNTAKNSGSAIPFSESEASNLQMAHHAAGGLAGVTAGWTLLRNAISMQIDRRAKLDSYEFLFAADLLGSYLSSCLSFIDSFTLQIQQAGASKLAPYALGEWERFAKSLNSLLDNADRIARAAPEKGDVSVSLKFRRVVENLTTPAGSAPPTKT